MNDFCSHRLLPLHDSKVMHAPPVRMQISYPLFNNVDGRSAQCKLREHLRPIEHPAQSGGLERFLGNYDRVTGIKPQVGKFIAPCGFHGISTYDIAIRSNDELALRSE